MAIQVDINDIRVSRGSFELSVDELKILPGEVFALLGRTGAGKTVLLETIAGAFQTESGCVLFDGVDIDSIPVQSRHMGIVYQDYALFPHMSVYDNIAYGLKAHGVETDERDQRVRDIMEMLGISHIANRYPGVISGGEGQRTALARTLVLEPGILLLDEPFSALDPVTRQKMYTLLRQIHESFGCTIVFVTHEFSEVGELADRVGIILNGRLHAICTADELFTKQFDSDVMDFLGR